MILRLLIIFIIQLFLASCSKHFVKQKQETQHYSLIKVEENKKAHEAVDPYKQKVDAETAKVIATSEGELTKDGAETTLGNFVCDALLYASKSQFKGDSVDVVLLNRGGLRINLPKGEIKVSTIFELMPFENELVYLQVKGEHLEKFLTHVIEKKHPFYGFKIKLNSNQVESAVIGGKPIDKNKIYGVLTSDYLANGGDSFVFLKEATVTKRCDLKIREAIINYCKFLSQSNKPIKPYTDGRLEISK